MFVNKITYRAIALTMAFLMLFSSAGFALDIHYCKGELKNVNIFGKAKSCNEPMQKKKADHCEKMQMSCLKAPAVNENTDCEKGCCKNETLTLPLDKDYIASENPANKNPEFQIILALFYTYTHIEKQSESFTKYLHYKPPIPDKDIPVLIQSFLI